MEICWPWQQLLKQNRFLSPLGDGKNGNLIKGDQLKPTRLFARCQLHGILYPGKLGKCSQHAVVPRVHINTSDVSWIAPISVAIPVAVTTPMHAPLEIVVEANSIFTCPRPTPLKNF